MDVFLLLKIYNILLFRKLIVLEMGIFDGKIYYYMECVNPNVLILTWYILDKVRVIKRLNNLHGEGCKLNITYTDMGGGVLETTPNVLKQSTHQTNLKI